MALALLRATHPAPALTVTVVAVLLGVAAGLEPWRVVVLGLATALDQASVGLSNDWIDAERDRVVGRRDKPVATGVVAVPVVRAVAIAAAAAALVATVPLGWAAVAVHAVMLGSAWAYNAGLKRTACSVVPFVMSFGLVPAMVAAAASVPALPAPWAVAAGALLGVAAHVANVLPDVEDDRRTGITGLPHRLPRPAAIAITWVALVGAAVALGVGIGIGTPLGIAGIAVATLVAATGVVLELRGVRRAGFRLVQLAAVLDVALLVAAGASFIA